jgi:hypothetical protein
VDRYARGYPRLAAFIDSDTDTVLFRKFGVLSAQSLLYKEVELTELEAQLDELNKEDESDPDNMWRLSYNLSLNDGKNNDKRKALINKIDQKMEIYRKIQMRPDFWEYNLISLDNMLLREAEIRKLSGPSKRVHRNFLDYVVTENALGEDDHRFIYHEHDFVSLADHEESWLDDIVHRFVGHCKTGPLRVSIFGTKHSVIVLTPASLEALCYF